MLKDRFFLNEDQQEQEATAYEIEEAPHKESPWSHLRLDGIKVLLVEDTPDARAYINRLLTRAGALVLSTQSADEARSFLANNSPDVIISDVAMPVEDGLSFIRNLREAESLSGAHVPAVAFTAFSDDQTRNQIYKAGFQAHVAKSSNFELLVATVYLLARGDGSVSH